jgi:two-component system, OmpR family, phosphate regulon sensor histidine kinase PhoR
LNQRRKGLNPKTPRNLLRNFLFSCTWTVTVGPVPMTAGRGVVLSFEDMTAMEESNQIRRDFVANVSHELRTPLTALLGFVETLKGAARDDAKARERFLGIMEREAGRMARLVDDLLSLSRVEQEERLRPREMVDLDSIIRQVINVLGPVAAGSRIELVFSGPQRRVEVPGDAAQLQQVATNLIENAIKYGGQGHRVEVRLSDIIQQSALRGPGVEFSVTDEGDGIEAHHIPRLTERFYRVDNHRSRELGGTGLGLAIVKHIVNRHRGRLRVDSVLGEGSTFRVLLPAV